MMEIPKSTPEQQRELDEHYRKVRREIEKRRKVNMVKTGGCALLSAFPEERKGASK